jgi:hypothetical protein
MSFGAAENGVSFGRFETTMGVDFPAASQRTFGMDSPATVEQFRTGTGRTNAYPKVGPIVLNEIMYHPPDIGGTNDNVLDEYIELHNVAATNVALFDPARPTNRWRLENGVGFTFPSNATVAAGAYLLVVNFDPIANPGQLTTFQNKYGVPGGVTVLGPYDGRLDNGGETIDLSRPDTPEANGFVPYILVDHVAYSDRAPWPPAADGSTNGVGVSLSRIVASNYGNEPLNWTASNPTPGGSNAPALFLRPTITQHPQSQTNYAGTNAMFTVAATGVGPLQYQWRKSRLPIPNATNATLVVFSLTAADAGDYDAVVFSAGGGVVSASARLTIVTPIQITQHPQSQSTAPGSNITFSVSAIGTGLLRYQWTFNGTNIDSATTSILTLTNVQLANHGFYQVIVTDDNGSVLSQAALLTVRVAPSISQHPSSRTVLVGSNVTFTVVASGTPPLGYRWRRGGITYAFGENLSSLTVSNAQLTNGNTYSVVVTNVVNPTGVSSTNAHLVVVAAPTNQVVNIGANATFIAAAAGGIGAVVRFQWQFAGTNLPNATNAILTLPNVQFNQAGTYTLIVTNMFGTPASYPATLTVLGTVLTQPQILPDGNFQMLLQGMANRSYEIEISTNLTNWSLLKTVNYTTGQLPVVDTTTSNVVQRFYRAKAVP